MKLIILEGGDRLGKSTIIEGICKHYNYDNVTVRHFGKPPKGLTPEEFLDFQFKCFNKELQLFYHIYSETNNKYNYYEDILIWNRSHLGEYVYSQMFRNGDARILKDLLNNFERGFISHKVNLITLTADPKFFHSKEDGQSFSQTLEQKTRELELFKEAHDFSIISDKLMIKVDEVYGKPGSEHELFCFRPKKDILKEVLNFIE